jgi:two-component system LytT family sensor kinase
MMTAIYFRQSFTALSRFQGLKVFIMIVLLVMAALLGSEITFVIVSYLSGQTYAPLQGGNVYILNILVVLVAGVPIYVSEEWKTFANSKLLNQQYRLLQLEQQKTVFELELLRAKINPHFLYNVHNTIAGLISSDPDKAEKLLMLLSKFFRFSLTKDSATFHCLKDELEIIDTYLQMQKIRFGERLSYQIDVDSDILNLTIPSFILQPIVENAIKHGIEQSIEPGQVNVHISLVEDRLSMVISDSGPDFSPEPKNGLGMEMVMNKLGLLYRDDFIFELQNYPKKHVKIVVPKRDQYPIG